MARCGKCGLFLKFDEQEQDDGLCVWLDMPIPAGEAFDNRDCNDYVYWVKDFSILDQVRLKMDKVRLFDSYQSAKKARFYSVCSLIISIIALSITVWSNFWRG